MSSVDPVGGRPRPRPSWLSAALYLVLLLVLAVDIWAALYWLGVGQSLGLGVAAVAGAVALLSAGLLAVDARRQWLLRRSSDQAQRLASGARTSTAQPDGP